MDHDANDIAAALARQQGLAEAIETATEGIAACQQEADFYSLSIWREVRRTLREWQARPPEE